MDNNLFTSINRITNSKLTENGAYALKSTLSSVMNAFGTLGAMRTRADEDVINTFIDAYDENPELAMKMLFYFRDARGGAGERRVFRIIAKHLAFNHTDSIERNLKYIPEFGRWDDLYEFMNTPLEAAALMVMKEQYIKDMEAHNSNQSVSLLAKWLKSANSHNKDVRALGLKTAKAFGLTEKTYRKNIALLRHDIDVVESKMSTNQWSKINYPAVPSKAHNIYRNAFDKHDPERYEDYISKVSSGEVKINADTLYPYDLIRAYHTALREQFSINGSYEGEQPDPTIEAQWNALPNYAGDKNYLVMADVSGSMCGLPMYTSIGLGAYFAERNTGAFKNHVMTFSSEPELVYISPNTTLHEKLIKIGNIDWGGSTNLEAAFRLILNVAIKDRLKQSDIPDALIVITDMELDRFSNGGKTNFTQYMTEEFENAGYKMPTLVWWNVNARQNTFHAEVNDNVRFVSGSSATVFKDLCENMGSSASEMVLNILMQDRYSVIK